MGRRESQEERRGGWLQADALMGLVAECNSTVQENNRSGVSACFSARKTEKNFCASQMS